MEWSDALLVYFVSHPFDFFFEEFTLLWVYSVPRLFQFSHCFSYFHFVFVPVTFATVIMSSTQAVCLCSSVVTIRSWRIVGRVLGQSVKAFQKTVISCKISFRYCKYAFFCTFCTFFEVDLTVCLIEIKISPYDPSELFLEIRDISSSIYSICAFLFIVISFIFLESRSIFIDLSFFTVITAGLTKQSSVIYVALST